MILEEKDGLLTIRYDFGEERLSLIIHNPEDDSENQINMGVSGIARLTDVIEIISESIARKHLI